MTLRCLRLPLLGATLAVALSLFSALPARAVGESPTVDGDLTDLIAAVNANLGSDQGGFAFTDPANDIFTGTCAYINGYDIVKSYAYFRLKDQNGAYVPNNVTLYLGWEVTGQIGDVDGNGNADSYDPNGPGTGCALSDGGGNTGCASGIGAGESYSILFNLNCQGVDELRLGVSNNKVAALTAGGDVIKEIPGAFCRVGKFLEVRIDHYEALIADPTLVSPSIGADLCKANLRMVSNAGDDLLAEDTTPVLQLRVPSSVKITKLPASQDACPGTNVSWNIQICNDGICPFSTMTVRDTLDAGLSYVSDDKGSVQGATPQIRTWTFSNVAPGACVTIALTAKVDFPCAAAVLNNNVGVEAVHPLGPCSELADNPTAHASALVNCTQPSVDIDKSISPKTLNPGQKATVTLTITNNGNSPLNPINVCDKLDAGVSFDAAQAIGGSCGVTLSSNTLNGDGTRTVCFSPFSLGVGGSCTITYQVGCVTVGDHPDTATVTAFCTGNSQNSVTDRDFDSFNCACPPDVEIGKQVNPPTVNPGQDVTVTLTISNPGQTTLDPINVCDKLDAGVDFDAAQVIGGTCAATLSSNTLNADGTRTLCFTPFSLNAGASCTITYKVRCAKPGVHPDTATVVAQCKDGGEQDKDQDQAAAAFTCACPPDVEIGKSVNPPTVNPGQSVTVTLTISNPGQTTLDPINVCDKLDAGVDFDAAQAIGGSCGVTLSSNTLNADGTRTICFTPFSLNAGASCTITYAVKCAKPGVHPDTASVVAQCKDGGEQDKDQDQAAATFTCACPPDVEIGKQVNPPTVNPGQDVTVTLTITNPGTTTLDPINVCDKLDAGVDFDAAQAIGGSCGVTLSSNTLNADGTRTICFTPFSLAPDGSCTITYKVKCAKPGVHPDTATVVAQCKDGGEQDKDQDRAAATFTCACPPDVEIGKSVTGGAIPGQDATVTLTISNAGLTVLDPINVCDKLDAGVSFDAAQAIGGTCGVTLSSNTLNADGTRSICFTPFSLPVGGSCTITYKVKCVTAGIHPDTATVVAQCKDGSEQDKDQDQAASSFNCACPADVEIGKSVTGGAIPGQDATVTLTISNAGSTVLDPINVCDKLDAGVSFDAAQVIGGTCAVTLASNTLNGDGSRTLCFTPFSLNPGASCTITYKVKCVVPGSHPDTATVIAQCKDGGEQDRDQDQAASSFDCRCPADVEIGKQVNPPTVNPGQDVTVTLTISNPGTTTLDPINVCDKLDAGVSFDAAQAIGGSCGVTLLSNTLNGDGTRTICFSPFSLAPDGSCTITYKVRCVTSGTHPDTATVIGQCKGGGEQDRDQDRAQSSFTCACPADVEIGKQVSPPNVTPGQDATITLTISNPGTTVLDPINVCDKLDAGVSFDAAQTIGGSCGVTLASNTVNGDGSRSICFTPFSLNPGASCTITYKVRCVNPGQHPDTATVIAQCKDGGEQDRDQDRATSSFSCACPADVEIGKSVNPPNVTPGQDVTITLTISNPGSTVLDPINVCDKLDAGVSFDAAQAIGGSCGATLLSNTLNADGTRSLCFTPFSLAAGGQCTITYKVRCVTSGQHPDTATVIARCKDGGEQDRDQDQAVGSFNCACPPNVEIDKSVSPNEAKKDEFVTVTLRISNPGSTVLDPINVCDKIDAGVGFDPSQAIGGTCGVTLASNTANGDGSRTLCFTPFSLNPGQSCTITYRLSCIEDGVHPDTATVTARCKNGSESDVDRDQAVSSFTCNSQLCCWLTMGGFLNANSRQGHKDNTYGGNVGPPPSGSWEHIQRNGKTEVFNFHSHDAHVIECGNDGNAGPCHPKGDANFIVFGGTGAYSLNGGSREFPATFIARAEDHGEPGRQGNQAGGCGTPDYYTITVFNKDTGAQVFTAAGYVDGGNIQIHDCKHGNQTTAPKRGGRGGLGSTGDDASGVEADGSTVGTEASDAVTPLELYRPQPNPFQNTTTVAYAVGGSGQTVDLGIYDVAGRLIRNLASGFQSAGRYSVVWDGKNTEGTTVSHGVYFLRAYVGGERVAAAASRILYLR